MRPSVLRWTLLAGLGILAGSVAAQPATSPADAWQDAGAAGDIVVTAQKRDYSRAVSDVRRITRSPEDVFAPFEQPICALALGMSPPLARKVERRIAEVASRVGLEVAGVGCRANLTLVVADDGRGVIRAMQRKMPNLLMSLTGAEIGLLKGTPGPVWSWYDYDQKRRDGGPVEHVALLDGNPPRPLSPHAYVAPNVNMSRLTSPIRLDMMLAIVVVDSRAAEALTVQQLGDAAAMMGLSMIDYKTVPQITHPSALQLLTDRTSRERIAGLTNFDRAYLSTLYSGASGLSAARLSARMAANIVRGTRPTGTD